MSTKIPKDYAFLFHVSEYDTHLLVTGECEQDNVPTTVAAAVIGAMLEAVPERARTATLQAACDMIETGRDVRVQ